MKWRINCSTVTELNDRELWMIKWIIWAYSAFWGKNNTSRYLSSTYLILFFLYIKMHKYFNVKHFIEMHVNNYWTWWNQWKIGWTHDWYLKINKRCSQQSSRPMPFIEDNLQSCCWTDMVGKARNVPGVERF